MRDHFRWYESLVLLRKFLLVLLAVLVDNAYLQSAGAILLLAVSAGLQLRFKPWSESLFNFLELCNLSGALLTVVISSSLLQFIASDPYVASRDVATLGALGWTVTVLLIVTNVVVVGLLAIVWLRFFIAELRTKRAPLAQTVSFGSRFKGLWRRTGPDQPGDCANTSVQMLTSPLRAVPTSSQPAAAADASSHSRSSPGGFPRRSMAPQGVGQPARSSPTARTSPLLRSGSPVLKPSSSPLSLMQPSHLNAMRGTELPALSLGRGRLDGIATQHQLATAPTVRSSSKAVSNDGRRSIVMPVAPLQRRSGRLTSAAALSTVNEASAPSMHPAQPSAFGP